MGLPGIAKRVSSSRATAALPLFVLLSIGCGNPFSRFYPGRTVSQLQAMGRQVEPLVGEPKVVNVDLADATTVRREYADDGWTDVGDASWAGQSGTDAQAIEQARLVGASLVLVARGYRGTTTTSVPITSPTTSTTYANGTMTSPQGAVSWSGTATTYGTQTRRINIPRPVYEVEADFLCRRITPPTFGVMARRMTEDEQIAVRRANAVMVDWVIRDSPAARAGIAPGDVLIRIGDDLISPSSWQRVMDKIGGVQVEVEWLRNGEPVREMVQMNP